jgi:hypothetical protein
MEPTVTDADILAIELARETVVRRRLEIECAALKAQVEHLSKTNVTVLPDMNTTEGKT